MNIHPRKAPPKKSKRIASSISGVIDSQGNEIYNPGNTADTVLTLSGIGTANSVVYIFDNGGLLTTASVTINGTWLFIETLVLGQHAFTVRDGLGGVDSPAWVVTVGEAELDLIQPTITQAPGGILNPVDAINGATVVVTYEMLPTDTIGLSWNGLNDVVQPQFGNAIGSVTFNVPASAVAAVIGKSIQVLYAVVRNGVPKPSEVLSLTVQTLSESVLEAPRIMQASDDGSLDVGALTGDAELRVKPWLFIEAGQQISLRFEGTKADGSAYNWSHPTWQNLPISSTGEPSTTVALSELRELKVGSSLRLIFEVSFSEDVNFSFPEKSYTLTSYSRTEDFDLIPIQNLTVGAVVETPAMTLTFLSGAGVVNISKYPSAPGYHPVPGKMDGNTLVTCVGSYHEQVLVIKPTAPCTRVSFYYTWMDDTTLRFYDELDGVMGERRLANTVAVDFFEISFPRRIGKMVIYCMKDWASYDHFSFQE